MFFWYRERALIADYPDDKNNIKLHLNHLEKMLLRNNQAMRLLG
jgi:hypothetical protein